MLWSLIRRSSSTRTVSKTSTDNTRWTIIATLTMEYTISLSINHRLKMKKRRRMIRIQRSRISIFWISRIRGRPTKMCTCLILLTQMTILMREMNWALTSKTHWLLQWMVEITTTSLRNFLLRHLWSLRSRIMEVKMSWKESWGSSNSSSLNNQMNYNNSRV